jgi:hypothetical protein
VSAAGAVFGFRKERRESIRASAELQKLERENEKLRRELEKKPAKPERRRVKRPS